MSFLLTGSKELSFEKLLKINGGYGVSANCGGGTPAAPTYGVGCTSNTCTGNFSNLITISYKKDYEPINTSGATGMPGLIADPGKVTGYLPTEISNGNNVCYSSSNASVVKEYRVR